MIFIFLSETLHTQALLATFALPRCCMAVKMGVASRRSMWCWTAMTIDSCQHTHWLQHIPMGQSEVWGRWAAPSSSLEENLQVPPSVGSVQRRPAVEVCSVTCTHCENFSNYKLILNVPARWCCVSSAAQSEWSLQIRWCPTICCAMQYSVYLVH